MKKRYVSVIAFFILIVVVAWCATPSLISRFSGVTAIGEKGQFGDQFGFINSLFTGLALVGLIATLLFQISGAKSREAEFAKQIVELKKQTEDLHVQTHAQVFFETLRNSRAIALNTMATVGSFRDRKGIVFFEALLCLILEQSGGDRDVQHVVNALNTFLAKNPRTKPTFILSSITFDLALSASEPRIRKRFDSIACAHMTPEERILFAYYVEGGRESGDSAISETMKHSQLYSLLDPNLLICRDHARVLGKS